MAPSLHPCTVEKLQQISHFKPNNRCWIILGNTEGNLMHFPLKEAADHFCQIEIRLERLR